MNLLNEKIHEINRYNQKFNLRFIKAYVILTPVRQFSVVIMMTKQARSFYVCKLLKNKIKQFVCVKKYWLVGFNIIFYIKEHVNYNRLKKVLYFVEHITRRLKDKRINKVK